MIQSTKGNTTHQAAFDVLDDLQKNAEALQKGDEQARDALVADCFRLVAALERPSEAFMRIMWTHTIHPPVIRLASDIGLFDHLKAAAGSPKHNNDLASATSADARLTGRVLKTLASFHIVKEVDADTYVATPFSDSMADDIFKIALKLMVPYCANANLRTPEYFQKRDYQWPTDVMDLPVQFATGDSGKLNFFEMMKRDDQFRGLESLMKLWLADRPHWSDETAGFYPIRERLITGTDSGSESVFLVDLGGGHGQDLLRLLGNVPAEEIPGRLILQDLPEVLSTIPPGSLPAQVELAEHDFFTTQPIKGARVYFMHSIIHNFSDEKSKLILKQVAAAMKKGYSKLLVWDTVMPDRGAGTNICSLDWEMLTFYGTSERTEVEWRKLLEDPETGLKVTNIMRYSRYDQDVIELELV